MPLFHHFQSGQDVGRGQKLRKATRVTLLEQNPEGYDQASLEALANHPFSIEEWLLLTRDYLIYRTNAAVMEHLRRVLLGTGRKAPAASGELLETLLGRVDADEGTMWLPLKGARARPWVFEGRAPALLGSRPVPFHYYEISVGPDSLYFLQQPVGRKSAQRDFETMSKLLRSGGTAPPGRG